MVSPIQSRLIEAELKPAAVRSEISAAIAAKSLDAQKQSGAAVLELLNDSAAIADAFKPSHLGQRFDTQG